MDEDIGDGRIRWFGEPWGASINQSCDRAPVPVGVICWYCMGPVEKNDRGVMMVWTGEGPSHYRPQHIDCFFKSIGIPEAPPRKSPAAETTTQ